MAAFKSGDRVKSVRGLGGGLIDTVPAGTKGQVVLVEHGVLSESVTVKFENGYTEVVKPSDLEKERSWF